MRSVVFLGSGVWVGYEPEHFGWDKELFESARGGPEASMRRGRAPRSTVANATALEAWRLHSGLAETPPVPPLCGEAGRVSFRAPKNSVVFFGTAAIQEPDPVLIPNSVTPSELLTWIERTAEEGAVNPTKLTIQPNSSAVLEASYYPETLTLTVKFAGRRDKTYDYRGVSPAGFIEFWASPSKGAWLKANLGGQS